MAKILIVDDRPINRQFLMTLLPYGGHEVLEAADGAQALELARAEVPDLVISDILMPTMDGIEFTKNLRAKPALSGTPVIFYSATYRLQEARKLADSCGVTHVLPKPSEPEVILKTINEALGVKPPTALSQPTLPSPPRGFLSVSVDAEGLGAISDRLGDHLASLQRLNDQMSSVIARSTALVTDRDQLAEMCSRLSESSARLQTLSLRVTTLLELGIDLASEHDAHRLLNVFCRGAHNIMSARYAAVGILNVGSTGDPPVEFGTQTAHPVSSLSPREERAGREPERGALSSLFVAEREKKLEVTRKVNPLPDGADGAPAPPGYLKAEGNGLRWFHTKGLSAEQQAELGQPAPRAGLLGKLLEQSQAVRLRDLDGKPGTVGLPASHPAIHSFLGVRIATSRHVYGWVYFADKLGANEFSDEDERIALTLAAQVATALEGLKLFDDLQLRTEQLQREAAERERAEAEVRTLNLELEQRVRERTVELEAANRELESFASSVSHDLRAPLRGIDGWSQALAEDYADKLDDRAREYLALLCGEAQRMGHLIDDLLELSRVTRAEMGRETVDLSELARRVLAGLRKQEPQRPVEAAIAPGLTATGDPGLLRLVLENLLGNAWKFTGQRVQAKIAFGVMEKWSDEEMGSFQRPNAPTLQRSASPVFFVRDNGAGFDMTRARKLFAPFQRLHRQNEFPGTGIGLATVQRIVRRHGGQVWAKAERDKGATFYFTL